MLGMLFATLDPEFNNANQPRGKLQMLCEHERLLLNELIDIGNWRLKPRYCRYCTSPRFSVKWPVLRSKSSFPLKQSIGTIVDTSVQNRHGSDSCKCSTDTCRLPSPTTIVINIHDSYIRVVDMGNNRSRYSTRSAATLGRCRGIDISVTSLLDWILTVTEITLISG